MGVVETVHKIDYDENGEIMKESYLTQSSCIPRRKKRKRRRIYRWSWLSGNTIAVYPK